MQADSNWGLAALCRFCLRGGALVDVGCSGGWIGRSPGLSHEIKHDGYRLMARRDPVGIP